MTWELFSPGEWAKVWKVRYMDGANILKPHAVWEQIRAVEPKDTGKGGRRLSYDRMLTALATFRAAFTLFGELRLSPEGLEVFGLGEFERGDPTLRKTTRLRLSVRGSNAAWIRKDHPTHGMTRHGHAVRYKRPEAQAAIPVKRALGAEGWYVVGGAWYPEKPLLQRIAVWADAVMATERKAGLLG